MIFQFHPYAVVLLVSALTTLAVSFVILRREMPSSLTLGGMLLGLAIWSGSYALSWSLTGLAEKLLWLKIMYVGVLSAPTLFLVFALRITHHEHLLPPRVVALLLIEPLAAFLLIWARTDVFFSPVALEQKGSVALLYIGRGIGFWCNTLYSYFVILLALVVLGVSARAANPFFRTQYIMIMLATIIPLAASIFTQISYTELSDLDMAPISFSISSILYVYAMFRHQLMDLLPVARGQLIESMSDGVLVVDAQGRIVDINPAMKNFLDTTDLSALIGRNVTDLSNIWLHDVAAVMNGLESRMEIKVSEKPLRYLDLRVTTLHDDHHQMSGRLIVFRDVTDRKEVERDLRRAMDRLQTQLIEIGILQSQLREQAIRDALTNLFNRRYLEETLERELARAQREVYPLCVIMMDLDHFKDVNDTYGHEAGDVVLKTLAETVKRQSRQGDFVCRYGGEEFVLVMPNIGLETARVRAEDLHQVINALNIPYGVFNLTTTISMGVAAFPEHGESKEVLLRAADRAMYIAKNTGRNRVVVYPETEIVP